MHASIKCDELWLEDVSSLTGTTKKREQGSLIPTDGLSLRLDCRSQRVVSQTTPLGLGSSYLVTNIKFTGCLRKGSADPTTAPKTIWVSSNRPELRFSQTRPGIERLGHQNQTHPRIPVPRRAIGALKAKRDRSKPLGTRIVFGTTRPFLRAPHTA